MFYHGNGHFENWAWSNYKLEIMYFLFTWEHNPNTDNNNTRGSFLRWEMSWFQQKRDDVGAQCWTQQGKLELKAELCPRLPETGIHGARKASPTEQKTVPGSHFGVHVPREWELLKLLFTFSDHSFPAKGSQCFFFFQQWYQFYLFFPPLLRYNWHQPVLESVILPWDWDRAQLRAQLCHPPGCRCKHSLTPKGAKSL